MGQILSEPITAKESAYCLNGAYMVGSSCMQGWRVNMEDSHTHILSLPDDPGTAFFGVYDGHGGASVAKFAGSHLHKLIVKRPEFQTNIAQAMKQAFLDIDTEMLYNETVLTQTAGSTAVTCIIKNNKLWCANAGDSRMIACINNNVDILSIDHKPNNEKEHKRICDAGGYVQYNRVNGNLALSRALGDFVFKRNESKIPEEQIVTAYPEVQEREITEDWEFAILACDGIWDVMSNEEVKDFVRQRIGKGLHPEIICEQLMNKCLAPDCGVMGGLGGDNMTVVLVCFLHNKPYEVLVEKCVSTLTTCDLNELTLNDIYEENRTHITNGGGSNNANKVDNDDDNNETATDSGENKNIDDNNEKPKQLSSLEPTTSSSSSSSNATSTPIEISATATSNLTDGITETTPMVAQLNKDDADDISESDLK